MGVVGIVKNLNTFALSNLKKVNESCSFVAVDSKSSNSRSQWGGYFNNIKVRFCKRSDNDTKGKEAKATQERREAYDWTGPIKKQ